MNEMAEWQRKVERMLAAATDRRRQMQEYFQQQMKDAEQREQQFGPLAERLVQTILRPRFEKLVSYFDNARLLQPAETGRYYCVAEFRQTERLPATVRLELAISTDGLAENLLVLYSLKITPQLFPFTGESQIAFPIDHIDEARLATWVEERLVSCVDAYLRLEDLEPYQRENLVTDPVCGMRLHKTLAAGQEEFQGQTYFFCSEQCQRQFTTNPARFLHKEVN